MHRSSPSAKTAKYHRNYCSVVFFYALRFFRRHSDDTGERLRHGFPAVAAARFMEYGCAEFLQLVVDVDLGGDLNVLVTEDLLDRVDVHAVPAQAGAVGMAHLVRGEHRNVRVTLVHAGHELLESLRKAVGIPRTAGLRGKQVQTDRLQQAAIGRTV